MESFLWDIQNQKLLVKFRSTITRLTILTTLYFSKLKVGLNISINKLSCFIINPVNCIFLQRKEHFLAEIWGFWLLNLLKGIENCCSTQYFLKTAISVFRIIVHLLAKLINFLLRVILTEIEIPVAFQYWIHH